MSERPRPLDWLFLTLALLFQATAVIVGKSAALHLAVASVAGFATNPWYVAALGCLVMQAFFWQLALRRFRLIVAYLSTSLNYLIILAASRLMFLERVTAWNLAGSAVIVIGVFLIISEKRA